MLSDMAGASGGRDLFLAWPDRPGREPVTQSPGLDEASPAVSPDGLEVAYVGEARDAEGLVVSAIFVASLIDGAGRQLTGGPDDTRPAWHPEGDRLAFATLFGDVSAIVITSADGLSQQPVAELESTTHTLAEPAWHPSGSSLAFVLRSAAGSELWVADLAGGSPEQLYRHPGWDDRLPAWSPDGRRLAFASAPMGGVPARYDLWLLDVASGIAGTIVTDRDHDLDHPAWAPDGSAIAYERRATGSTQGSLQIMPLFGDGPQLVTTGRQPDWFIPTTPQATSTAPPPSETPPSGTPTGDPPFPTLPPPPPTAPLFPTPGPPEATIPGPAPTFPVPTATASATNSPTPRTGLLLPWLANRPEPSPTATPTVEPGASGG